MRLFSIEVGCAAMLLLATAAGAEVRRIEAVGAVPIYADRPEKRGAVAPRDGAIRKALREAVERVAEEFIADLPLSVFEPGGEEPDVIEELGSEGPDLEAVLGQKMVLYTSRFRVVEDRGERPALFADDPAVTSEYVVIVEVHVDVERVRERLVQKGIIPEGIAGGETQTLYLQVEGLTAYPAYEGLRAILLDDRVGVESVVAVEMRRGRTLLRLESEIGAAELLEKLRMLAPPEMKLVPLHVAPDRVHIAVDWSGPVEPSGEDELPPGPADSAADPR
jgi:hypothetical protein